MLDIAFVKPALPRHGALVLPIAEGAEPAGLHAAIDTASGGGLGRALAAAGFKGRKGQTCTVFAPTAEGANRVVAIGLGPLAELTAEAAEAAGGAAAPLIAQEREATVAAEALSPALAAAFAHGVLLRGYRFDRYRTAEKEDDKPKLERVAIAVAQAAPAKAAWAPLRAIAEGVYLARDLVSEPGNILVPAEYAERCRGLEKLGVEVEIFGPKDLKRLNMGAFLGVAQGSAQEPRLVVLHWQGAGGGKPKKGQKPLCFVGKGVTFDSGGISIKPAGGMEEMKTDMAGSAAVIGAIHALAARRAKVDVVGIVGLVENMVSGTAQRPGDVVKTAAGLTVEVINTDAEGRLVLADLLWYAQDRFEPSAIVDLATLTGAIVVALGHEHAGMFANDDALAQRIAAAGAAVGEACWRMPLGDAYDKQIKSDIADMKNVGGRPGGAVTAAQFLQRFIEAKRGPIPWAHLDIAGVAWGSKDRPTGPKGATAFGVRLLDRLAAPPEG